MYQQSPPPQEYVIIIHSSVEVVEIETEVSGGSGNRNGGE